MYKLSSRLFSFITLLSILITQAAPFPVAAASPGVNGKIAVIKDSDIWLVDPGGAPMTQLTYTTSAAESSPSWSSDGSQLAYVCHDNTGICIMDADGNNAQLIVNGTNIQTVDWRPGCEELLYVQNGELWHADINKTYNTPMTSTGSGILAASYSPDGNKIAYSHPGGIELADAGGTIITSLSSIAGDASPSWSPDGQKMLFTRGSVGSRDIWVMQATDGTAKNYITNDGATADDYEATWSPDGDSILFTNNTGLWIAEDDGDNPMLVVGDSVRMPSWQPINTFTVNSSSDGDDINHGDGVCETSTPGECTLRAAIQETNDLNTAGTLTINLADDVILGSDLEHFANITGSQVILDGSGYEIRGMDSYSLIHVEGGANVHIEKLTLTDGLNTDGGAIYNAGNLTVINTIIKSSSAGQGGAIYNANASVMYIAGSLFKNNTATSGDGGAIANLGTATIVNSTFNENTASGSGGAIVNLGDADLYNDTIVLNHAGNANGGGFAALNGSITTATNSIFSGNVATGSGGGPEVYKAGSANFISNYNLYGTNSLDNSQVVYGVLLGGYDRRATSDGSHPRTLEGILNASLTYNSSLNTAYHTLVYGSPAIDAGDDNVCDNPPVEQLDQRGLARPVGPNCDIGSYEADSNLFLVTNTNNSGAGSLSQAIADANTTINISPTDPDQIQFAIPGPPPYIISPTVAFPLPSILDPIAIDGMNKVVIYGGSAGASDGLTIAASNSIIQHLTIKNFAGAGVAVIGSNNTKNIITQNSIYNNGVLDLDLGDDGVSFNHHHSSIITGPNPNNYQNYPVLDLATFDTSYGNTLRLVGSLEAQPSQFFEIHVYKNLSCHSSSFGGGREYVGTFMVNTDGSGKVRFDQTLQYLPITIPEPQGISVTATGLYGTSEFSYCRPVSTPNLNWVDAQEVMSGSNTQQYMTDNFQEKWFKFAVAPGSTVQVKLTSNRGSAISLHTDPNLIYDELIEPDDETALSAQSANVAFLPSGSLPSGSLPSGSLPSGSLPSGSLPSGYLPSGSLPSGSLPSGSLPSGSLPFGALPSGSLPSGSLPSGSLPSGSLPSGSLPSGSLPSGSLPSGSLPSGSLPSGSLPSGSLDAYATAARRSLIGISMNPLATEHIIKRNTYDYLGDLYVRIVGPYNLSTPFQLDVDIQGGVCDSITAVPDSLEIINGTAPSAGTHKTLLLTDSDRLVGSALEKATALAKLQNLANRPEVDGVVINLSDAQYERVVWANTQADQYLACPSAKNLVADEIKNVIDAYWDANPSSLEYIVLAGGAGVIPYFQVQDVAEQANEKDYVVPVAPSTASEAGLASNLVQGQDGYGSGSEFTQAGFKLPFPDLAVGRLVDSASDITSAINSYIATGGVVQPTTALVTGYDFVGDGAEAVKTEIQAGIGITPVDTLIQPPGEEPDGPNSWSATDLKNALLASNHGVISLSGHFSAGDLLAADYASQLSATNLSVSTVNLTDSIILTLGCHGGYTIPNGDLLTGASPDPDWAKAILRKGAASYIAATGYAYGDTELVEYGERLFLLLSQQMRADTGPIAIGHAFVAAKQQYLAETAQLTGVDHKTITEMTLYGLPMMQVDMPGTRLGGGGSSGSIVTSTTAETSAPGVDFSLSSSPVISVNPLITLNNLQLKNLSTNSQITTTYYTGANGVVSNPYEPIYPKEIHEVQYPNSVLRGIAFRGGTYSDQSGIIPLTTAPATETTNAHKSFHTSVFYPTQMWMPNYTDAINGGSTWMMVFPMQYRSSATGAINGILRTFTQLNLQFFYLPDSWDDANTRAAAVSPAPSVLGASATEDNGDITFTANVTADGSAGVQAVWVLYTGKAGTDYYGTWTSLDLTQDTDDPDTWTSAPFTPLNGTNVDDLYFIVQAVGGAGLTTLNTNNGAFFSVSPENITPPPPPAATTLSFVSPPSSGVYSQDGTFTVHLDSSGTPVADKFITLNIDGNQAFATTDSNGDAEITIALQNQPGIYTVQAAFDGDDEYLNSSASTSFTIDKDTVVLTFSNSPTPIATIKNASGYALVGKSIVFVLHSTSKTFVRSVNSNFAGKARLDNLALPAGVYTIDIYFSGTIPVGTNSITLTNAYYQNGSLLNAGTITSTAPSVTITAKKADNTTYTAGTWTNQTVTVHFECSDSDGVATCPADQTFSSNGTFNAPGTATDTIGNPANVNFGPIKIDKTPPTLSPVIGPKPVYLKRTTTARAKATDALSGILTQSCGPVNTNILGTRNVACTAKDKAGNIATKSISYTVIYKFVGFAKPVYNLPSLNQMKAGLGVQIKFSLNGNQSLSVFASGYPRSNPIACTGTIHTITTVPTPMASNLKYTSSNKIYTYTWKTSPSWANTCRQFVVKFKDGRVYRLNFKFLP